ncbi:MAG: hypothetical protein IBX55_00645 [Methyloprofundus sp.]|nr:hypothetical protein [Methyloprofundus sp.]
MNVKDQAVKIQETFNLGPESIPVIEEMIKNGSDKDDSIEIRNLAMLVKKLVHSMKKQPGHNERLAKEAMDYLDSKNLIGSPLR